MMMKINSNNRYLLAPTIDGKFFCWNLKTGQTTATLGDHGEAEMRVCLFHPFEKYFLTGGDDNELGIRIYKQNGDEIALLPNIHEHSEDEAPNLKTTQDIPVDSSNPMDT